jgi:hypothetical protein
MFLELLKTITRLLEQNGIGYMVSGSLAVNVCSVPRMTLDIDYISSWCNKLNLKTFNLL